MSLSNPKISSKDSPNFFHQVAQTLHDAYPQPDTATLIGLLADINPEKAAFFAGYLNSPEFKNPNEVRRLIESHVITALADAIQNPQRLAGRKREEPTPIRQLNVNRRRDLSSGKPNNYPQPPPPLLRLP
jgi:hypothetical protein